MIYVTFSVNHDNKTFMGTVYPGNDLSKPQDAFTYMSKNLHSLISAIEKDYPCHTLIPYTKNLEHIEIDLKEVSTIKHYLSEHPDSVELECLKNRVANYLTGEMLQA